jgi:glycosyltransferase involved in cell wall biosynthesis
MPAVKVLHIITRMCLGGAEENTLFTVNGLDPTRFRTTLAVGGESDPAVLDRVAAQVEVVRIPELVRDISPRRDAMAFSQLWRHMRERDYDIVHTHMAKAAALGRFAARAAKVPRIINTVHGSTLSPHFGRAGYAVFWSLEKVAATFTDKIVTVGEDLRDRYLAAGIGTPDKYQVIRSGMDLRQFQAATRLRPDERAAIRGSLGVPPEAQIVGKIARLESPKGHQYFFELAQRVLQTRPNVHFVCLGTGDLLEPLRADIGRRGLADRVHLCGFRKDIARTVAALDLVVLTSLCEGLPRVLVQAAAAGVPAVTFEVEGAREIGRNGVNGYVVPSKDVASLTERVLSLLADPARAQAMGSAGRALVHDGWTVEAMVGEITELYDSLSPAPARQRAAS